MKRLDRYIVGKFLGTFGFMLGVFCMVVVVFDLMEHLGRLLDHQAPVWDTALYYLNVCFHFASLLMGFIVFLTIIWFTSRLAQNSEIIAMLAGGMPFKRLFRPYFYAAGLLVVVALVLSHGVVPRANEQKLAFEESFVNTSVHVKDRNLYREVSPGTIVYFRSINYGRGTGYKLQLEQWQGDTLVQRMLAAKATYIPQDSVWRLVNVGIRDYKQGGRQHHRFLSRLDTTLTMRVDDFAERNEVVATMPTPRLRAFIDEVQLKGSRHGQLGIDLAQPNHQCGGHLGADPHRGVHCGQTTSRRDGIASLCRRPDWVHLRVCLEGHLGVGRLCGLAALVAGERARPAPACRVAAQRALHVLGVVALRARTEVTSEALRCAIVHPMLP